MANRYFNQFRLSLEKQVVDIFGSVSFGASGAPTLDATNSKGIKSVTRTSAGLYVFTLGTGTAVDKYGKLLMAKHCFVLASGAPASPSMFIVSDAVTTAGTITVQFNAAGTATDPASGDAVKIQFVLKNSTTP